jgi:hypothetical protein
MLTMAPQSKPAVRNKRRNSEGPPTRKTVGSGKRSTSMQTASP